MIKTKTVISINDKVFCEDCSRWVKDINFNYKKFQCKYCTREL